MNMILAFFLICTFISSLSVNSVISRYNSNIQILFSDLQDIYKKKQTLFCNEFQKNGSGFDSNTESITSIGINNTFLSIFCYHQNNTICYNLIQYKGMDTIITDEIIKKLENSKNQLFIDISAKIGWYSLVVALKGFEVYAFEQSQEYVQLLRKSVCINQLNDKITIFPFALDYRPRACELIVSENYHDINAPFCFGDFAEALDFLFPPPLSPFSKTRFSFII